MTSRRSWQLLGLPLVLCAACGGGSDAAVPEAPASPEVPEAPAGATCGIDDFAVAALALLNEHRARGADCGSEGRFGAAPALRWNVRLAEAAAGHSTDMAARDYFAHVSPDGGTMTQRVEATGYRWSALGENLAAGQRSLQQVVDGWVDSDGHCANVMNPRLAEVGMACIASDSATYPTYWTMNAGSPR